MQNLPKNTQKLFTSEQISGGLEAPLNTRLSTITASTVCKRNQKCLMSVIENAKNSDTGMGSRCSNTNLNLKAFGGRNGNEKSENHGMELETKDGKKSVNVNSIKLLF